MSKQLVNFIAIGRKWIVQNIDKWDESTERTQNIEFDDNIWIFIFLFIG
jgi:hypothetical protein